MPLLLTEADVKSVFTMPMALELVETSFERLAEGKATLQYRQRLPVRAGPCRAVPLRTGPFSGPPCNGGAVLAGRRVRRTRVRASARFWREALKRKLIFA